MAHRSTSTGTRASASRVRHGRFTRAARAGIENLEQRVLLSVSVTSYHNDAASTGQNLTETSLTPGNVNSTNFGKLHSTPVDGQVYAQPLYVPGENITGGSFQGVHNVAYVATEHDSLYAIDSNSGQVLWQDSFLVPDSQLTANGATVTVSTVTSNDVNTGDISPQIGITSTPAIDTATGFLYLTAKTKQIVNGSTTHFVFNLYKVNIHDGTYTGTVIGDTTDIGGSFTYRQTQDPYVLDPKGQGGGVINVGGQNRIYFNALKQHQRSAVTLYNGNVYIAFASHGDNTPYHGWILGFNESTLATTAVFNTNPNANYDGIWQGGGRIAIDPQGFMYVETGNGPFDTTMNAQGFPINGDYGDSFLKIALDPATTQANQNINGWGLKVADYFTPSDQQTLSNDDTDLGSGGPMVLPDTAGSVTIGSAAAPHLLIGSGKNGTLYLLNRDKMGKYTSNDSGVVDELTGALASAGAYGSPTFFYDGNKARIYYIADGSTADSFTIAGGIVTPDANSTDIYANRDGTSSVSANNTANGIVWNIDTGTNQLRAYNASNIGTELYTSSQNAGRDSLGTAVKFSVPTVADGQVLVGTANALVVYGELVPPTAVPSAPSNLTATGVSALQINLSWQNNSPFGTPNYATGFYIEQSNDGGNTWKQIGTTGVNGNNYAVTGLAAGSTYSFRIRAFNSLGNSPYSNTASATTTNQIPTLNFGSGFANASNAMTLNGSTTIVGSALQLTDGGLGENASAFSTAQYPVQRFNTTFQFQLTNAGADGFTFTVQGVGPTALGSPGGDLGYAGIGQSVCIKFDLYDNSGEGTDSTGLFVNGDVPSVPTGGNPAEAEYDMSGSGVVLNSGDVMQATLNYDGTTLQETVVDTTTQATFTQSYPVNIPSIIGGNTAYLGFTGGTGGVTAVQQILNWTYTPLQAPPATPTGLTVTPQAYELDLSWSDSSSNVGTYNILHLVNGSYVQFAQVPGTTTVYHDTGLAPGTTESYEVVAVNAAGSSQPAGPVSGTTPTPPAGPTNLTASMITTSSVTLNWQNNATNATGYKIVRQLESDNSQYVTTLAGYATTFPDSGLLPGRVYAYTVVPVNQGVPGTAADITIQTIPSAPSGLTASAVPGGVSLNWTDLGHAVTGYNIYRGTSSAGEAATPIATNVSGTTFTDSSAAGGQTYFYYITAVDSGGAGAASNEVSAAPLPVSNVVNGVAGIANTITLRRDGNSLYDDVWVNAPETGAPTQTVLLSSPITINSGGLTDTLVLDSTRGAPLGASLILSGSFTTATLSIGANQAVALAHSNTGNNVLTVNALSIDPSGVLDVSDNTVKIRYGAGVDPDTAVHNWILEGRSVIPWRGTGITSSDAAARPGTMGVGWLDQTGLQTEVIRGTLLGDANLDGKVDVTDLGILSTNFGTKTGAVWSKGDFDYNGTVDVSDLGLLATNFGKKLSPAVIATSSVVTLAQPQATIKPVARAKPRVTRPLGNPLTTASPLLP